MTITKGGWTYVKIAIARFSISFSILQDSSFVQHMHTTLASRSRHQTRGRRREWYLEGAPSPAD